MTQGPVCAGYAVQGAGPARWLLRLTAEVNPGYSQPPARHDLAIACVTQGPVSAGHTVQGAGPARWLLRLTAGVNPGYSQPPARPPEGWPGAPER